MAPAREVSFELERFEWTGHDRLEVVGRWQGLHGRRLARPALTVDAGGRRKRLAAMPGGHLPGAAGERWKAAFAWDGNPEDIAGAELEIGRSLVVELPAPRRKRRMAVAAPAEGARLREEIAELKAEVAELRAGRAAPAGEDEEEDDAAGDDDAGERLDALREEHDRVVAEHDALGDQHALLRAQTGELRGDLAEAHDAQERLSAELREMREQIAAGEAQREGLASELAQLRADLQAREEALTAARAEAQAREEGLAAARAEAQAREDDVERRLGEERAVTADVREKLATAREEAQRSMAAEAEETERLRAELAAARDEAERALATERAETARLREELADAATAGGDEEGDGDEPARRMYERVSRELERERAAARTLRRDLDSLRADTADQRRTVSSATANGILATEEAPAAATAAGRQKAVALRASRHAAVERAQVHRHTAGARGEPVHATTGVWVARAAAFVLVALLLLALMLLVSALA
jgi:hypothetical protein